MLLIFLYLFIISITRSEESELSEGSNLFGFDLVDELYSDSTIWISSFCISSCFGLVYPGSNGNTQTEISNVLHYEIGTDPTDITKQFFSLQASIESNYDGSMVQNKPGSIIGIANKIYVSSDITLKKTYIDALSSGDEDFIEYNFDFAAHDAKDIINQWVSDNTNELIDSIISETADISNWKLAALNAIYLNGTFQYQFKSEFTSLSKFYSDSDRLTDIHLMHQIEYFDYYQDDNYQYLKFPFADHDKDLFILFALPLNNKNNQQLLDNDNINEVLDKLEARAIALALPKLFIQQEYILNDGTLQNMGMIDAFTRSADFSKMSYDALFINTVIHKTMVEMDEKGLVAAAVTLIAFEKTGNIIPTNPILFRADHPYQMFIVDGEHENLILFQGIIHEPGIPENAEEPTYDETKNDIWTDYDSIDRWSTEEFAVIDGSNLFGFDLVDELYQDSTIWISSYCISACFGLIYPGSAGNTQTQISNVLHYPINTDSADIAQQFFMIQSSMRDVYDGTITQYRKASVIGIANKIYLSSDIKLKQTYIDALSVGDEDFIEYNFDFTAHDAKDKINKWVSDNTNELIDNIISESLDISDWKLAALNAIYLNGTFKHQFDAKMTSLQKFYSNTARDVEVTDIHLMHQFGYFEYYQDDNYQYLKFPFDDHHNGLFIVFVLPSDETVDGLLSYEDLNHVLDEWKENDFETYIALALPKISIKQEYLLSDGTLQNMGMIDAFTRNADFSKMSDDTLFIDTVIHKTMVEMDENGLVAAAVTIIGMVRTSLPPEPILFKADHPFQIFIVDEQHGNAILFMGKINIPGIPQGSNTPNYDESSDEVWTPFIEEYTPPPRHHHHPPPPHGHHHHHHHHHPHGHHHHHHHHH